MNSIRSVYPKDNRQIANWIDEGLLEYADKERMFEWLSKQQSNSADVRQQLERAANVIKDYKNPKESGENNNTEDYTRFRAGGNKRRMPGTAEQSKKTTIATVVSDIPGTKILKNLDNIINDYKNLKKLTLKEHLSEIWPRVSNYAIQGAANMAILKL